MELVLFNHAISIKLAILVFFQNVCDVYKEITALVTGKHANPHFCIEGIVLAL